MATTLRILFGVAFLMGFADAQTATSGETATQQVLAELRSLRVELLEDLAERQAERIELLAAELERVRTHRIRIERALQSQQDDTRNWNQEVQTSEYTPEQRAQLETAKAAVDMESSKSLSRERHTATDRESVLNTRLNRERERHRSLTEVLRALRQPR